MSIFWAFVKNPKPKFWVCRLSTSAKKKLCKQLTEEFRSNSVAACMIESEEGEGENGLRVTVDIC